jgi:hypothetical protein
MATFEVVWAKSLRLPTAVTFALLEIRPTCLLIVPFRLFERLLLACTSGPNDESGEPSLAAGLALLFGQQPGFHLTHEGV